MRDKGLRSLLFVGLMVMVVFSSLGIGFAEENYTIENKAPMIEGRDSHSSVVVDGKVYVLGGRTKTNNVTNMYEDSVEEYDPIANTWASKTPMINGRRFFASAHYNGKIYVFGGATSESAYSAKAEAFNIATNTWEEVSDMPTGRHAHQAVTVGNRIFVIGGVKSSNASHILKTVEIYNPDDNTWETGIEMLTGRADFGIATIGSKIYVMGGSIYGSNGLESFSNSVNVYNAETNTWSTCPDLLSPRNRFDTATIGKKIYIVGGHTNINEFSVDMYDTVSNTWNTVSQLQKMYLYDHACTSIGNKIYLTGGNSSPNSHLSNLKVITVPNEAIPTPLNLSATAGNNQVTLNWEAVEDADSYTLKRSTTSGGPYTVIADGLTSITYTDTDVTNGTTYYYVVTAVKSGAESENSNEASATPVEPIVPVTNRALLNITMENSLVKEYDMAMTEVEDFIEWYNSSGGSKLYIVNKSCNIGPFLNRKDYLVKDMIVCFEVMEYDN